MKPPDIVTPPIAMLLELWNIKRPTDLRAVRQRLARVPTALGSVKEAEERQTWWRVGVVSGV